MPSFLDRLGRAAQQTAAAAQQAAAEAKAQLEIRQISGKFDEKAAELGKLVYRQQQGEDVPDADLAARLKELREIDAERAQREAELQAVKAPAPVLHEPQPPATPAPTPPAEPATADTPTSAAVGEQATGAEATPVAAPEAASTRKCECGTEIPEGARFCPNCGKPAAA